MIHTAFNHDFSKFPESAAQDQRAIEALGSALEGSKPSLILTSRLSGLRRGAAEMDLPNPAAPRKSEAAARALAERGIRAATVRLAPSVHGSGDRGFIPIVLSTARTTGHSTVFLIGGLAATLGLAMTAWSRLRVNIAAAERRALTPHEQQRSGSGFQFAGGRRPVSMARFFCKFRGIRGRSRLSASGVCFCCGPGEGQPQLKAIAASGPGCAGQDWPGADPPAFAMLPQTAGP